MTAEGILGVSRGKWDAAVQAGVWDLGVGDCEVYR